MSSTHQFERRHEILIQGPAASTFDYVTNPNSWLQWIAASHQINSPDHSLREGETFSEEWQTRKGGSELRWTVIKCERPNLWIAETQKTFIGKITARYDFEKIGEQHRFTRTIINEDRPTLPTAEQIERVDEEATISLANIKRNVEAKLADQ